MLIERPAPGRDFRCTTCGYGVVRVPPPAVCPMCAGTCWERHPQSRVPRGRGRSGAGERRASAPGW
jgi:rubredoxin